MEKNALRNSFVVYIGTHVQHKEDILRKYTYEIFLGFIPISPGINSNNKRCYVCYIGIIINLLNVPLYGTVHLLGNDLGYSTPPLRAQDFIHFLNLSNILRHVGLITIFP